MLTLVNNFSYYKTIIKPEIFSKALKDTVHEHFHLRAIYIKPIKEEVKSYWLLTTLKKSELNAVKVKKLYNKRSGDKVIYNYLKNDFNLKKTLQAKISRNTSLHSTNSTSSQHYYKNITRNISSISLSTKYNLTSLRKYSLRHTFYFSKRKNKFKKEKK